MIAKVFTSEKIRPIKKRCFKCGGIYYSDESTYDFFRAGYVVIREFCPHYCGMTTIDYCPGFDGNKINKEGTIHTYVLITDT